MKRYEAVDISGDAGVRAFGKSAGELFANAALGMCSLIADPETVRPEERLEISLRRGSLGGLLVAWLNELIFLFDARGFLARDITAAVSPSPGGGEDFFLTASVSGEHFDPERHRGKLLLKAATYHRLKVEQKEDFWTAEVIFDI
ncbi:MAG: archease [Nitrospiraceae bacterium]|nr:archease [Nitrospiraceae bacterium]